MKNCWQDEITKPNEFSKYKWHQFNNSLRTNGEYENDDDLCNNSVEEVI